MNRIFYYSIKIINLNLLIFLFFLNPLTLKAEETVLFLGEVNTNNINIRSDANIYSEIICKVNKAERLEIVKEYYEWYRVRLPKSVNLYIKKDFVNLIDEKSARVNKNNVNIRLKPSTNSVIVGKANKDELVKIIEEEADWYKIEATSNCFGWIYKKFINKI